MPCAKARTNCEKMESPSPIHPTYTAYGLRLAAGDAAGALADAAGVGLLVGWASAEPSTRSLEGPCTLEGPCKVALSELFFFCTDSVRSAARGKYWRMLAKSYLLSRASHMSAPEVVEIQQTRQTKGPGRDKQAIENRMGGDTNPPL